FLDFENAGRTKRPKGENIKSIIDRNNLDKAVYIGDTQGDYDATKIAGIPFIHAKYGFGKINEETNFINEISELPIYISKLL
ncbi:MAG TPA: HAD family hydrolase, partial [Sedimentibacter sp.]|nr:HAD family hydrolase [Sedimentibacter sp.]